jgi:hypothetical protein
MGAKARQSLQRSHRKGTAGLRLETPSLPDVRLSMRSLQRRTSCQKVSPSGSGFCTADTVLCLQTSGAKRLEIALK